MNNRYNIKLKVPHQELERSSYFDLDDEAVDSWVELLPMANLGQTTRQLYLALSEINRVRLLPSKRMVILEKLRTPIYFATKALSKHYLNKPITLPDQPRKVADLAHTLHLQLAIGYIIVATHTASLGSRAGISKPSNLIAPALHRAITDYSLNMQRHYQLYEPVREHAWHDLHQFYQLAKQQQILSYVVNDKECDNCSVESAYIRALLIGCSKPNQLRQEDFIDILKPLTHWAELCQINPANNSDLFIIDPTGDNPPQYSALFDTPLQNHWLSLDSRRLANHLSEAHQQASPGTLKVNVEDYKISLDLLSHLLLSWSKMSKRTFMRLEANDTLELCVGLSATHHFVSDELSFEALVEERGAKTFTMQQENPFMKVKNQISRHKDVWDSPYEANVGQTNVSIESIDYHIRDNEKQDTEQGHKYNSHTVQALNASAHGYCIEWPQQTHTQIRTGEIVGIKETHSHNWSIAVIRWVSHNGNQQTQLGLQLISPSAAPYGARIIRKTGGDGEYVRVLILPEIPITKQPMTLLTPRLPFKPGLKVVLNQRGKEVQLGIGKKLNDTGAYNQFEFKRVSGINIGKAEADDDFDDDFNSLWGNL